MWQERGSFKRFEVVVWGLIQEKINIIKKKTYSLMSNTFLLKTSPVSFLKLILVFLFTHPVWLLDRHSDTLVLGYRRFKIFFEFWSARYDRFTILSANELMPFDNLYLFIDSRLLDWLTLKMQKRNKNGFVRLEEASRSPNLKYQSDETLLNVMSSF